MGNDYFSNVLVKETESLTFVRFVRKHVYQTNTQVNSKIHIFLKAFQEYRDELIISISCLSSVTVYNCSLSQWKIFLPVY